MTDSAARFDEIDSRLEQLGEQLAQFRAELTENRTSLLNLQTTASELLNIAQLHQQSLRIQQRNAEADRLAFQAEMRDMRNEIRRIWEYLLDQRGNGHGS